MYKYNNENKRLMENHMYLVFDSEYRKNTRLIKGKGIKEITGIPVIK